jgi:hypothetical protein
MACESGPEATTISHPHQRVEDDGEGAVAAVQEDVLQHAGDGQRPDHAEEPPSPFPAEGYEREGRVGAGDQEIDRAVVEDVEDLLRRAAQGVVERRAEIEEEEHRRVDGDGGDLRRAAAPRREADGDGAAGERQHGADDVSDGVEALAAIHPASVQEIGDR